MTVNNTGWHNNDSADFDVFVVGIKKKQLNRSLLSQQREFSCFFYG
jgi:hypothetical protein